MRSAQIGVSPTQVQIPPNVRRGPPEVEASVHFVAWRQCSTHASTRTLITIDIGGRFRPGGTGQIE